MNSPYLFAFIAGCFAGLVYLAWPYETPDYDVAGLNALVESATADDYLSQLQRAMRP